MRRRKGLSAEKLWFDCALLTLFLVISPISSFGGELSTYDIVMSGKACKEYPNKEISCDFKVGNDLHFIMEGIGGEWTRITFMKSEYEGDFYATYGLGYGCVVVKRGEKNWKNPGCGGPGSAFDYAFISSKNGKVYRNWEACQEVK